MTDTTQALTPEQREAVAGVWNALCVLIADHPMWIGDDGEPLDYLPEREARVSDFVGEATDALAPLIARMVADAEARALREAADERAAKQVAADAADRFRDVLSECLGHEDENPGDDVLMTELREHFGRSGPEPTRWRDFCAGALAVVDQLNAEHAALAEPTEDDA